MHTNFTGRKLGGRSVRRLTSMHRSEWILKKYNLKKKSGLDSSGSGQVHTAGLFEHSNKASGSKKCRDLF